MGRFYGVISTVRELGRVTKEGWLDREAYAFFFLFFFSLWLCATLLGLLALLLVREGKGGIVCCKSLWDTFFSYSYTLVMDVLADNQANNCNQQTAQNNNSDYMGLALKQWSVYLGNVLLNFIHKECKNGHMSSPSQIPMSQSQQQFYKNNFCPCCHYNYHHNGYYNYAHFLGSSQRQYVRIFFLDRNICLSLS